MNLFRKTFLMLVGVTALTLDEVEKSINEATEVVEERRKRFIEKSTRKTQVEPNEPALT
jgi:hypothetical protein